jgi:hypothetical protein
MAYAAEVSQITRHSSLITFAGGRGSLCGRIPTRTREIRIKRNARQCDPTALRSGKFFKWRPAMLTPFTGFRGVATVMEIGGVQFVVIAKSPLALQQLHARILPDATEPFDPAKCQKSILIHSKLLPDLKKS